MKILIRADGDKRIGMGHLYETRTLAKYLKQKFDYEIVFIIRNNRAALNLINRDEFRIYPLKYNISQNEELEEIKRIIDIEYPQVIIMDVIKNGHSNFFMKKLKSYSDACCVVISNALEKIKIFSDIVIHPSLYQDNTYYEDNNETKYYLGFDYFILPFDYLKENNKIKLNDNVKKIMVCMGGSDHNNLSFEVIKTIDKSEHSFCFELILNSSFFTKDKVDEFLKEVRHKINVYYDLDGISNCLFRSDLAITAGGNTHIERLCAGVPGIVINQLKHQAKMSKQISKFGATVDLGFYKNVNSDILLKEFNSLLEDKNLRKSMSVLGKKLVDGKGIKRISNIIASNIN